MINDSGIVVGVDHIQEIIDYTINNIKKHHSNLLREGKIIIEKCDGRKGFQKYAPYKVIHVGAAAPTVPSDLISQLDYGGRMFIPVGEEGETQWLSIIDKDLKGKITQEKVMGVCYVPLTTPEKQLQRLRK
jgi:protein-L-isoaspartate(D-aspartate) O-methyltransferase